MSTVVFAEEALPRLDVAARVRRIAPFVVVGVQVALALLVIRQFRIESRTFYQVALLAAAGAVLNAVLPRVWRLPAFALISAAALAMVVGTRDTLFVLGFGAGLVALCHLPVRFAVRAALLVAAGALLMLSRGHVLPSPMTNRAWAVLGSMFMFRLALYFHAVRHEPARPTPAQTVAYFLMLPNPVCPLFPVVDFTTFVRSHYAEGTAPLATYQKGAAWIARGLSHLLLYRVVYHNLPGSPLRLGSLGALIWYVVGTFLLYLRVSGQFHLIVGMLGLYGFDLPETHKLFFLSSSFTDFWRRINIYWKDFMMKLVYYPSFFRLRKHGATAAMVGATITVFATTWVLHSYQWFWLLGRFLFTVPDVLFWTLLGALVVVTSLREAKRGRDRKLGAETWSLSLAWRVLATFCALAVLWSLWSTESIVEWVWMWRAGARVGLGDALLVATLVGGGLAIAGRNWTAPRLARGAPTPWWRRVDVRTAALLAAMLLARREVIGLAGPAKPVLVSLYRTTLNARDAAVERRGYYENLDRAPRLGAQGWETRARRPADFVTLPETKAYHARDDFRLFDLVPNTHVMFLGRPLTTNAFGMRDAPRTLEKPAGTVRLAFMGPSVVMGSGVGDGEAFPAQLERKLNTTVSPQTGRHYEALNFAMPAHSLLQELTAFEEDAVRFHPDVAVLTAYAHLWDQTASHLASVVARRIPIPYPGLDSLVQSWHASPRLPWSELLGLMRIASDDVHAWALHHFAAECRSRGIVPVLVMMDIVGTPPERDPVLLRVAREEGIVVLDLFDVYPNASDARVRVGDWDRHPNALGQAMVADALVARLRAHPALLAGGTAAGAAAPAAELTTR